MPYLFKRMSTLVRLAAFAVALAPAIAGAQRSWPEAGPISFIVPFSPGGGADIMARLVAQKMSTLLGQAVVVQNKPGASGQIGEAYAARSAPDGYTVLFDATPFVINPYLYKLSYDPLKDFTAVGVMARFPLIATVPPSLPVKSVSDFVALAKAKPGETFFASVGVGSVQGLAGLVFSRRANVSIGDVPYKGGAPATVAVMSGEVQLLFGNGASALAPVRSGNLRALAVTGEKRLTALPDVPTLAESGIDGMNLYEWNGMFVPSGTPSAVVDRLSAVLGEALDSPEISQAVADLGGERLAGGRAGALAFITQQSQYLGKIIRDENIRVNAE